MADNATMLDALKQARADIIRLVETATEKLNEMGAGVDPAERTYRPYVERIDNAIAVLSRPQGVTVPHDALENDCKVVAALRQRLAELEARAAAGQAAPEGWAMVPVDPTDDMCDAAWEGDAVDYIGEHKCLRSSHEVWRDMLSAAPPAPSAWRPIEEAPTGAECLIDVMSPVTYRWLAYKPSSDQARKGVKGRWQRATEHGWENADLPKVGDWRIAAPVAEKAGEGAEGGR